MIGEERISYVRLLWGIAAFLAWGLGQAGVAGAQKRVFLTTDQALEKLYGKEAAIRKVELSITDADRAKYAEEVGIPVPEGSYVFYEHVVSDSVAGRSIVLDVTGQYQPITFIVAIRPDGDIERVEIMVYRESRGSEVRRRAFLEQYEDKSLGDPIRVNSDITNISGATISSRNVTRGVRLALLLHSRLLETREEGARP